MKIIKLTEKNLAQAISQSSLAIKAGQIIIYPTDTIYGLCADPTSRQALEKLLLVKRRSAGKPIAVVMRDIKMIKEYCEASERQEKILKQYLPGPLTFILSKKPGSKILVGTSQTLGVRIPNHPFCQKLSQKLQIPYTTTSANLSGEVQTTLNQIVNQFKNLKDAPQLLIDAGEPKDPQPSTVIDLTHWPPILIREGRLHFLP